MGNCCERCFGRLDKRKYLRTRYNVERDFSIEFENLMEDEGQAEELTNTPVITSEERHLLRDGKFAEYVKEQQKIDRRIDEQLVRQEEELREEEEAYYEAKREAALAAKIQKQKELQSKGGGGGASAALVPKNGGHKGWVGEDDSDWEVAGGEDDFEMFLESVRARSLAARTRALPAQVPIDQQSTSSITSRGENSRTEASSIDLEWEHEAGMGPPPRNGSLHSSLQTTPQHHHHHHQTQQHQHQQQQQNNRKQPGSGGGPGSLPPPEDMVTELTIKPLLLRQRDKQESLSNDFEWDNDDFIENSAEDTLTLHGGDGDDDGDESRKLLLNEEDRENDNNTVLQHR